MAGSNKRGDERILILGDVSGEITVFQPMTVKEISRGGAQVETTFPLHLDSLHDLRLSLRDRSVVVKGRVAHCRIVDVDNELIVYRSGIEFIEPAARIRTAIVEFLEMIKAGRRAP